MNCFREEESLSPRPDSKHAHKPPNIPINTVMGVSMKLNRSFKSNEKKWQDYRLFGIGERHEKQKDGLFPQKLLLSVHP